MFRRALLYWHTIRHLRPVQIVGRLRARLPRFASTKRNVPRIGTRSGLWAQPAKRQRSMTAPMTFSFLGKSRKVFDAGWESDSSQLWTYNLHYFDDLNAHDATDRMSWHTEAIRSWISANPPTFGVGWDPYPTSLRIVNWIKWAVSGSGMEQEAIDSLAIQVRTLRGRLEYHLLGNHIFSNAKALVFAGLYFDGAEADQWLEVGFSILAAQVPEQILPDGGQFERSPMYHALALEDLLDLINLAIAFHKRIPAKWRPFVESWPRLALRMLGWLRAMCHPDGEIAFFNDAAIGIAPPPSELERYAKELVGTVPECETEVGKSLRLIRLTTSGYLRAETSNAVLLMDVAPVGPDYLPGHAHADTLSFELSLFGQRLVVNGGTSQYGLGPVREAERSTRAHSTVTVDNENSSEVWAGFRVARRARPYGLVVQHLGESIQVTCAHDGYRRLAGRPNHRRVWHLESRSLRVEDQIEGAFHSAVARFHLCPSVAIEIDAVGKCGTLRLPGERIVQWRVIRGTARIEDSVYCPEFGRRDPSRSIALDLTADAGSCLELVW